MLLHKLTTLLIVFYLLPYISLSQTASGTAANNGTEIRPIANPSPMKPESPESNTYSSQSVQKNNIKEDNSTTESIKQKSQTTKPKKEEKKSLQNTEVDNEIAKAYNNSLIAYYNAIERKNIAEAKTIDSVGSYQIWALENRQTIIARQQLTGSIIFVLVAILLLSGLIFSAIQFRIAIRSLNKKNFTTSDTTFKASLGGIEVSSSILGVIILTISLAFFYLYLTNVYPLVSLDQLPMQVPTK